MMLARQSTTVPNTSKVSALTETASRTPILMNALVIQHNFIEAHTTIDEVPSIRAGQELDLGENKWLGLIRLSAFSSSMRFDVR